MSGHIRSGYAVKPTHEERDLKDSLSWCLHHHRKINPKKSEEIRVVFDCVADYQGWWLNECLLSDPTYVMM